MPTIPANGFQFSQAHISQTELSI